MFKPSVCLLLFPCFLSGAGLNNGMVRPNLISYSPDEMEAHKNRCREEISSNPLNLKDHTYQMERALRTISGDDVDYIPKVDGAGEIYAREAESYQLMHNGVKILANSYYDVKWLTDVIFALKGHHEPQEEKCFYEILKFMPDNATMIELGSYWAYYSLWFASEVRGAKNYLIEPDPHRLKIGEKNFQLNNKTGTFRRGYVGSVIDRDPDLCGADQISIDDFIDSEGIEHVNIIHADIQGSEYDMLNSVVQHLKDIDYFFISTHGDKNIHLPCLRFFKTHGYAVLAEHNQAESCSGDGLIVAKRTGVEGPTEISIRKY